MDSQLAGGSILALAVFLATFIEFAVERVFGKVEKMKGLPMILISMAAGILLCIGLNIDVLKLIGFEGAYLSWIGQVMSGIIIGSGSNMVHVIINPTNSSSNGNTPLE